MKLLTRYIIVGIGCLCLLCAIGPALYGVYNLGVLSLFLAGAYFLIISIVWPVLFQAKKLRRLITGITAFGIFFVGVLSALMVHQAFLTAPPSEGEITVIVLGGQVIGDQPSRILRNRLDVAAAYLLKNPDAACIVSGGQGPDEEYPEAYVMAGYLVSAGVESERIHMEDISTNTRENLRYSRAMIENADVPVAIATDGFHQLRSSIYARSEGLTVYSLSSTTPWGLFPCYWIRDMFGVIVACWETGILLS